ncbi:hypothetical protein EW026_g5047 [Hermanssonia centrifuga]|uniref:DUF6534 domain-containing protein n=1 Tax=Hermanssonia centrifuga TaxID=98765 RepID=A0A4S4KFJ2_9APHY|nr:hypothetical protein EW026_g5047 [Hermanssonia centrifuga]
MANLASRYGPIFIGVVFNILLYGIMITQTFLYFAVYKNDRFWMKAFVGLLFLCDTINCALDVAFVYIPLVSDYGNQDALNTATWVFATDPAMTAIIALLVQMFFAWRVKVLTGNWFVVGFIALCSICQWCGGLGTAIAVGMIPEFVHFQKFEVIVIIWLVFSALADTAITLALTWHLRKHKTGFTVTDDVVDRIIRMTVQTGLVTALCAIIDLIAFLATPTGIHLIFNLPLSKLYTNSLMSSLNSRAGWGYSSSAVQAMHDSSRIGVGTGRRPVPQVFIDVETHEEHEMVDQDRKGIIQRDASSIESFARQAGKDGANAV